MNILKQIILRLKSQSPAIFKVIFAGATTLAGLSGAILATTQMPGVVLNDTLVSICSHVLAASAGIAFIAKMTVKNPQDISIEKTEDKIINQ